MIHERAIRLVSNRDERATTQGVIRVQSWSASERSRRAIQIGSLLAGLGLVSVILPILHFFLVPGFLIAAPIAAWSVLRQQSLVLGGEGPCPDCGAPFQIGRNPERFPMDDVCTACRRRVQVQLCG